MPATAPRKMLLIDFSTTPPKVKRVLQIPWMGKPYKVTHEAELHSVFPGIDKQLEAFLETPEAFEVWRDPEAA